MKKRIFGMALILCFLVGLLPMTAFADGTGEKPAFYLEYSAPATSIENSVQGIRVEMKPGDDTKYWVTGELDKDNYPGCYFMQESTEAEWNVKLEYPADGMPTVTLKNAKLENVYRGLAFIGGGKQGGASTHTQSTAFNGDVKLILEGKNEINNCHRFSMPLYFHVTGTATVTGAGSLSITHSTYTKEYGIICANGNLMFDNAKVSIKIPSVESRSGNGIVARGGDITVKGGSLFFDGHNQYPKGKDGTAYTSFRCVAYAIWATKDTEGKGGNLNVQDNADVQIYASHANGAIPYYEWTQADGATAKPQVKGLVRLENALNVSDSMLIIAVTAGTSSSSGGVFEVKNDKLEDPQIGLKLNFQFKDGYTITIGSNHTTINDETGEIKLSSAGATYVNETPDYATATSSPYFFMVTSGFEKEEEPDPTEPSKPTEPTDPTEPSKPTAPTKPTGNSGENDKEPPKDSKMDPLVLTVILSVLALTAVGVVLCLVETKPKK